MKKILIFIVLIQVSLFASISTSRLDSIFNSVGRVRMGLNENDISNLQTPFVGIIVKQSQENPAFQSYNLYAVFGKLAKINENWYKVGDHVGPYTVKFVGRNSVSLINENNEERVLKFKEGKSDVKIEIK